MSQESVALVRSGFAAFEQGDLSAMLDLMADDLVTYRADPDGATYHGKEGFLEATADWTEGFSDWSVIPEEFIDTAAPSWCEFANSCAVRPAASRSKASSGSSSRSAAARVSKVSFYIRRADALAEAGPLGVGQATGPAL